MKNSLVIFLTLTFILLILLVDPRKENKSDDLETTETLAYAQAFEREKLDLVRQDSLIYYNHISDSLANRHQLKKAILFLDTAISYANFRAKDSLVNKRANLYIARHKYDQAIEDLNALADNNYDLGSTYYKRAKCYQKKRSKQKAVDDLKLAIKQGHLDAEKLHEKINPERKRVSYYITRCCDGSTSSAKGRGACSHHGGVCNWNEPVYETYRKY